MKESITFKKVLTGDCKLYEVKKGENKRMAMLATLLPNSQVLHDEIRIGHNIEIYYLNPTNNEIEDHEIIFLSS